MQEQPPSETLRASGPPAERDAHEPTRPRARASTKLGAVLLILSGFFQVDCSAPRAVDADDGGGGTGGANRTEVEIDLGPGGDSGQDGGVHPLCGKGTCDPGTNAGCKALRNEMGFGGAGDDVQGLGGEMAVGQGGLLGWGGLPDVLEEVSACRVVPCSGDDCEAKRRCEPAGRGKELDPCFSPADCAPGLTCIGEGSSGVCRAYCCDGRCSGDSYCEVREQVGPELEVPVCVPYSNCSLDDPYPCPPGSLCSCGGQRACLLVGPRGRTACLVPGEKKQGEACTGAVAGECAAGYVCAKTLGCVAICRRSDTQNPCEPGFTCQVPADFPDGFGVCVGTRT